MLYTSLNNALISDFCIKKYKSSQKFSEWINIATHCGRSVAFTTAHWGDYFGAFIDIAKAFPKGEEVVLIRGLDWKDIDDELLFKNLEKQFEATITPFYLRDLNSNPLLYVEIARKIRSGAHFFPMCDLDYRYGSISQTDVFYEQMYFANGWAKMVYTSKSLVVMIIPKYSKSTEVEVFSVIDPRKYDKIEPFLDKCRREIGYLLMELIKIEPSAWYNWDRIQYYLNPSK